MWFAYEATLQVILSTNYMLTWKVARIQLKSIHQNFLNEIFCYFLLEQRTDTFFLLVLYTYCFCLFLFVGLIRISWRMKNEVPTIDNIRRPCVTPFDIKTLIHNSFLYTSAKRITYTINSYNNNLTSRVIFMCIPYLLPFLAQEENV